LLLVCRKNFGRAKGDDKAEKLKGALMTVCHDCKAMVLEIIRSSRAAKVGAPAAAARQNLRLNLPSLN